MVRACPYRDSREDRRKNERAAVANANGPNQPREEQMKRLLVLAVVGTALAAPASASAFHHGSIPASECAASTNASNNPTAREAILVRNPVKDPGTTFPPFGTPGAFQGRGDEHCAGSAP
jgi:hypothetical protein